MNSSYLLPVFATMQLSWQKVKGSKASIWGAEGWMVLLIFVLGFIAGIMQVLPYPGLKIPVNLFKLLNHLLSFILFMGVTRLGILWALGQPIAASMVFYPLKKITLILKLIGCWLLYVVIMLPCFLFILLSLLDLPSPPAHAASPSAFIFICLTLGLSLSMLLSIFILVRVRLSWAFILHKELGPWQAMTQSFNVTQHNFWRLFAIAFLNSGIFLLSILPLGLGLIWSVPYLLVNYGQIYRQMVENQR